MKIANGSTLPPVRRLSRPASAPPLDSVVLSDPTPSENSPREGEGVLEYLQRSQGKVDPQQWRRWVGMAGPFKEGDQAIGVAALDEREREQARQLLANTRVGQFHQTPLWVDAVHQQIEASLDPQAYARVKDWTVGQLRDFVLQSSQEEIHALKAGLPSDAIASVVKLMSNEELIAVGQKVFNPLPGSSIGARGYLGARIQPNSPTDDPEDVLWQVLDAWAFGVGDVMLGTNPVSGTVEGVGAVERCLKDLVETFELKEHLPWVVLSHIDIQNAVEKDQPGSTSFFFQSVAGTESANQVFDVTVPKMVDYARGRKGRFGLYLETGQGADFTNGQAHGVDMGTLEARKYGLARALKKEMRPDQWMLVNDVAGFIGPEVFRTKDQLVRVALEDTVMGKLHGLAIGLDICATFHMPISLEELDQAQDEILRANPAYLMALPTKLDPMLSYATTANQDHLRLRQKYGYRVAEPMEQLFRKLEILDDDGKPTEHFGDPFWVYAKYCRAKGDCRPFEEIYSEGEQRAQRVVERGVPLAVGRGEQPWEMEPSLKRQIDRQVGEAKKSLWTRFTPEFLEGFPHALHLTTQSQNREDYILHPPAGEVLSPASLERLQHLPLPAFDTQIVISEGLNARALTDPGHLQPFLGRLRQELTEAGHRVAPQDILVENGRVRVGYRIGEEVFGRTPGTSPKTLVHVIGERPGTPHHNFSVYVSTAAPEVWGQHGLMDHDRTQVVSGISDTALDPCLAAHQVAHLIGEKSSL